MRTTSLAFILLYLFMQQVQAQEPKHKRPNILYIMADDHTAQSWGIYGGILAPYAKNNNIKRLATEGAVLNHVFCTNSICTPSRATILTGQYSNKNGVYTLEDALSPDKSNIAKDLHAAGYQTAMFGKWHLKKQPAGFDTFAVLPGQGIYHDPSYLTKDNWNDEEKEGEKKKGFVDDISTDMTIDWLKARDTSKPFFVMCHFKATHEPFDFADRNKDLFDGVEFPYPENFSDSGASTTGRSFIGQSLEQMGKNWERASTGKWWTTYPGLPFSTEGLSKEEARKKIYQKLIKDYLRCAAGNDDNIGRLLDYLKQAGLDENTVVIYTADQGYFLGEHDFMDKRLMYEESLQMPFVIRYPQEIKPGTRVNDMVLNIDFAALFADYAGIKKPAYIQGESFRKILEGGHEKNWRHEMYYRYWQHDAIRPAHFGIRNERYKLIFFYGLPLDMTGTEKKTTPPAWEFYDLQKDPNEDHNAINDPQYASIIKKMKKELEKVKKEAGDTDEAYPELRKIYTGN